MWNQGLYRQPVSETSFVRCKCGRQFREKQHMLQHMGVRVKRVKRKYRVGRFQCSVCLRRFPEKYRLSDHHRSTCHTGINEIESNKDEDDVDFDALISSNLCPRIRWLLCKHCCKNHPMYLPHSCSVLTLESIFADSTDIYTITHDQLESFIADTIQADSLFQGCCGEVINQLVRSLQDASAPRKLRPRRIIKVLR